jgi:hypothetical protein
MKHVDDAFIGAAVQRALQRADGGGDGGVHVAQGGGDDAGGEGGGVEAVLGVEDVGDVERALGFEPIDRELEKLGYDIESRVVDGPDKGRLRFIEVKGRVACAQTITVTKNEILYSLNKPEDFILAIVEFREDGAGNTIMITYDKNDPTKRTVEVVGEKRLPSGASSGSEDIDGLAIALYNGEISIDSVPSAQRNAVLSTVQKMKELAAEEAAKQAEAQAANTASPTPFSTTLGTNLGLLYSAFDPANLWGGVKSVSGKVGGFAEDIWSGFRSGISS